MNELSSWYQPLIEALGLTVFHGLWQGILLFFAVQSLLWLFKKPAQRYRVLYIAFCLLFVSFAFTFCIEWRDALHRQQKTEMTVAAMPPQEHGHNQISVAASKNTDWQHFYQHPGFKKVLPYISLFYLAGLLFLSVRLLAGVSNTRQLRRQLIEVPAALRQRFLQLLQLTGIRRKTGLFFSERVKVPLMIGYLKPLVILPVALINRLDLQQTETILLHELAHIKRLDYLFNLLQSIMELFLFFNPVTWWLTAAIRKERELSCDDVVMEHTVAPIKYAEALFQLELSRGNALPALAATGNNQKHILLTRIKRIIEMKSSTKRAPQGIFAALTGLLLLAAIGCYTATAQEKQEPRPKAAHKKIIVKKQYQQTAGDDVPDIDSIVNNAMSTARTAIAQINWDDVSDAVKQAGDQVDPMDKKAMEQAFAKAGVEMEKAQKQLQEMDWPAISNSLNTAEQTIAGIDWDAIGHQVTDAIESADMPDSKTVRDAMRQARIALDSARTAMRRNGIDFRSIADSVLRVRRQIADSVSGLRQQMTAKVLKERRVALDKAKAAHAAAMSAAQEAYAEAKRAEAAAAARSDDKRTLAIDTDGLLSRLASEGRIDRNKRFNVNYEDGVLEVNGKTVPAAAYRKYLPAGKKTALKITGKKGSLSVSSVVHD